MHDIETPIPAIIFFSPNGTAKKIASWFSEKMMAAGLRPELVDLTKKTSKEIRVIATAKPADKCFLVLGTPVYAGHPPKPVIDFLNALPVQLDGSLAIVYATYGGVTCGATIKDVARILAKKNVPVIAAAKIVAHHSLLLDSTRDRFAEHPSLAEEAIVAELVNKIKTCFSIDYPNLFHWARLPPRTLLGKLVSRVVSIKLIPPPKHLPSRCNSCGKCIEACSVHCLTITNGNHVKRGKDCAKCFNCLKTCPNHAWHSSFIAAFPRFYDSRSRKKKESSMTAILQVE